MILAHEPTMRSLARKLTRNAVVAEDVFQDACILALQSSRPVETIDEPALWMRGHVRNANWKRFKHEGRYVDGGHEIAERQEVDGGQHASVELSEALSIVETMTPLRREIFGLVMTGHSQGEIARSLGMTEQAVGYHVKLARQGVAAGRAVPDGRSTRYSKAA